MDMDTTNEPVALTQGDILGILQDANSVPLGQPIWNSTEEYNKLKAIIESAIRYSHPVSPKYDPETGEPLIDGYPLFSGLPNPVKELTDEEITEIVADKYEKGHGRYIDTDLFFIEFARAILRKASEK
jgi:hypothetical protein